MVAAPRKANVSVKKQEASVSLKEQDDWPVIVVHGEMDLHSAPLLDDGVARVLPLRTPPRIAIDLSGLTFCDSSCINALLRAWKRITALGGRLVFLRPSPRVSNLLNMTGLDQRFEILEALPRDLAMSN
ncbi:STAS domain-containing protein [Actinomadura decatromicini]|nr:STAS domain-containing protein [Actinomadura decatromicini]